MLSSFREVALTNRFSGIFHFSKISKFKRGITPRKKLNENFLQKHYVSHNYKVSGNSVERFQRSCADKEQKQKTQQQQKNPKSQD